MPGKLRFCVVGGLNVDLVGAPDAFLLPRDSNPGTVTLSLGGVGRNIAENLAKLGAEVQLVTVLGDDAFIDWIRRDCAAKGIGLSLSKAQPHQASGLYLCLNDEHGNLYGAVSDMRVCDAVTPAFLEPRLAALNKADAVVLDANLPEETLLWLAARVTVPMAADPVSVRKSARLASVLPSLYLVKPNLAEGAALTGLPLENARPGAIARELNRLGVRNALVSLGAEGVWYADGALSGRIPCPPGEIVSTNGCGDALFAAALTALLRDLPLPEAARIGQAAAALCARSSFTVSPELSWAAIAGQTDKP